MSRLIRLINLPGSLRHTFEGSMDIRCYFILNIALQKGNAIFFIIILQREIWFLKQCLSKGCHSTSYVQEIRTPLILQSPVASLVDNTSEVCVLAHTSSNVAHAILCQHCWTCVGMGWHDKHCWTCVGMGWHDKHCWTCVGKCCRPRRKSLFHQ